MAGPWENYQATDNPRPQITIYARPSGEQPEASSGPWSKYAPSEVGVGEDVVKSIGGGLGRGAAGIAGLPDLMDKAADYTVRNTIGRAINAAKSGGKDWSADQSERMPTGRDYLAFPSSDTAKKGIESVTGPLYEPKTTAGHYASTAAEFVPGTLMGGGGNIVTNAVKYGVIPGLTSEAAGQATKGTDYEGVARVGGALAGAGAAAIFSRPGTASRAIREQLPPGITPKHIDDAAALIANAKSQGVDLAWPEALSQVAGRPVMTNLMRHLEASPQTEAKMAEFFGQRPGQIETAGRNAMDNLAPANHAPSTIGPAVGQAAEGVVNDVRGAINKASEPLYKSAETVRLSPSEYAKVQALPGFDEARKAVRGDPQLNRYVSHLPDDSVGFLNEVKKFFDQSAQNASAPVNAAKNMQRSAGYGADAEAAANAGTRASADYAQALHFQAQAREKYLQPLLDGPLGKLASKDTTTKAAIDAVFPTNPLPNSAKEISQTVGALANRSPRAAGDLVRAHAESVFNESTQALQSGANQAGGAKFRAVLVGNPQQKANFEAAVKALPNGADRLAGFNNFLDVAEATGTRQGIGSRTAYNTDLLKSQGASGLVGEGAKAATNPLKGAQFLADKYERWRLGNNLNELADILTNPAAANQLRAIAKMPPGSRQAEAIALRLVNLGRSSTSDPVGQSK